MSNQKLKAPAETEARTAGLMYVQDSEDGYRRQRQGTGFKYLDAAGHLVRDRQLKQRFARLGIPPAWKRVWICESPRGHLQATGYDARGRKQYRYHVEWSQLREAGKFERLTQFARLLPGLRRRVARALKQRGLPQEKVLATALRILDTGGIRVGNLEYARSNGSFGLTTLKRKHVEVHGNEVTFCFRGKSGLQHCVELEDARLSRIIRKCSELPGQRLFQFVDDEGERHPIDSTDVNRLIQEWTDSDFTAKDFRTWAGTVAFVKAVMNCKADAAAPLKEHLQCVAKSLGNTAAICRKHYIHPQLIEEWIAGSLPQRIANLPPASLPRGLTAAERITLQLLTESKSGQSQKSAGTTRKSGKQRRRSTRRPRPHAQA